MPIRSRIILGLVLAVAGCCTRDLMTLRCVDAEASRCGPVCQPAGFDTTRGGCICVDDGWSDCACRAEPVRCAASGGPVPKEWRLW